MVRHPWYLAGILLVWGRDLTLPSLVVNIVVTGYFVVGAHWEEKKLVREFGGAYVSYQREVPMLVPYRWLWTAGRRVVGRWSRPGPSSVRGHDESEQDNHI